MNSTNIVRQTLTSLVYYLGAIAFWAAFVYIMLEFWRNL